MSFTEFTTNAIKASSRWFYLNEEVKEAAEKFSSGIYIYTDRRRWEENKFKVGETIAGVARMIHQQGYDASIDEPFYVIAVIEISGLRAHEGFDKKVHVNLDEDTSVKWIKRTEWLQFKNNNPEELVRKAIQQLKGANIGRVDLMLTLSQMEALDEALGVLKSGRETLLTELAPRFGKTVWAMALFDNIEEDVMVVGSYVLSALTSFGKDCVRFTQFENMVVLDSRNDYEEDMNNALVEGKKVIVLASLVKSAKIFDRYAPLVGKNKFIFVDEADFGAHKKNSIEIIDFLSK